MWQSQVEIKHYSVEHFDCVTAFEAAHMHCVDTQIANMSAQRI